MHARIALTEIRSAIAADGPEAALAAARDARMYLTKLEEILPKWAADQSNPTWKRMVMNQIELAIASCQEALSYLPAPSSTSSTVQSVLADVCVAQQPSYENVKVPVPVCPII
jgi:hypothetical protein